jgi:hypothetical protein
MHRGLGAGPSQDGRHEDSGQAVLRTTPRSLSAVSAPARDMRTPQVTANEQTVVMSVAFALSKALRGLCDPTILQRGEHTR